MCVFMPMVVVFCLVSSVFVSVLYALRAVSLPAFVCRRLVRAIMMMVNVFIEFAMVVMPFAWFSVKKRAVLC